MYQNVSICSDGSLKMQFSLGKQKREKKKAGELHLQKWLWTQGKPVPPPFQLLAGWSSPAALGCLQPSLRPQLRPLPQLPPASSDNRQEPRRVGVGRWELGGGSWEVGVGRRELGGFSRGQPGNVPSRPVRKTATPKQKRFCSFQKLSLLKYFPKWLIFNLSLHQ